MEKGGKIARTPGRRCWTGGGAVMDYDYVETGVAFVHPKHLDLVTSKLDNHGFLLEVAHHDSNLFPHHVN